MSDDQLTDAEKRYLDDVRKLPTSLTSRLLVWSMELVPSIGLFVFGLYADRRLFVVLGFLSLLYFSVWRMYGQLRGTRLVKGIYDKMAASQAADDSSDRQ